MNAVCHEWISSGAVRALSGNAGKYWTPEIKLLEEASNFPDIFLLEDAAQPRFLQKYPEWRDYIMIPQNDGGRKNCHAAFDPLRLWETYPSVLDYLVDETLNAMAAGDRIRAVKFAGVLSHLIGDTGQAAHVGDPRVLSPPVSGSRRCLFDSHVYGEQSACLVSGASILPENTG